MIVTSYIDFNGVQGKSIFILLYVSFIYHFLLAGNKNRHKKYALYIVFDLCRKVLPSTLHPVTHPTVSPGDNPSKVTGESRLSADWLAGWLYLILSRTLVVTLKNFCQTSSRRLQTDLNGYLQKTCWGIIAVLGNLFLFSSLSLSVSVSVSLS